MNLMEETPETVVGPNVTVKGDLKYSTLLRIDGTVDVKGHTLEVGRGELL